MTRKTRYLLVLCAAFQAAVVLTMIARKQAVLYYGRTVVLESQPVDPHSLFQGDYARLRFALNNAPAPGWKPWPPKRGAEVFAELAPSATFWNLVAVHPSLPEGIPQDHAVLRGRVVSSNQQGGQPIVDLDYAPDPGWLAAQPDTASWRQSWRRNSSDTGLWQYGNRFPEGAPVFVHLGSYDGSHWELREVSASSVPSRGTATVREQRVLTARAGPYNELFTIAAEYGIETFFVPEGQGRGYERRGLPVEIAVDARGNAVVRRVRL